MTIFEFALAREVHRLMEERKTRPLTPGEAEFLAVADSTMSRIEYQEVLHDKTTSRQAARPRN